MLQENYLNKIKELPAHIRQLGGLTVITIIVILFFAILNAFFGQGEELVVKMKQEEKRIAQQKKLSKLISTLPSGILVPFEGTNNHILSEEQYKAVCNATRIVSQRAVMGANLINFKAHKIYTINGNKIDETFVKWDEGNNKCVAGFVLSGNNVGVNETITVSGEALSFFNTGIDTRVYFIKNF